MKGPKDYRDIIGYWLATHETTPVLDTSQYADGDVLAETKEIATFMAAGRPVVPPPMITTSAS